MRSLDHGFLRRLHLSTEQGATLRRIGEHKGRQALFERKTPEVLDTLKQVALIESSESSNRIEGIVAPHKRIERIVLKTATPRNPSEQEIADYRDVLNLVHESTVDIPVTTRVIRQLHQMLYRYFPSDGGSWKSTDNEIVERDAEGQVVRVRFKAVGALETPQAMEELIRGYDTAVGREGREPLVVIPLTVLDFLCIHPFTDGNGRIARLLILLLLYHFDYQVGRYISLERIFEESGQTYFEALEASSQRWYEGRHKDCPGTSRETIRNVLRALRDEGIILSEGVGRGGDAGAV